MSPIHDCTSVESAVPLSEEVSCGGKLASVLLSALQLSDKRMCLQEESESSGKVEELVASSTTGKLSLILRLSERSVATRQFNALYNWSASLG